jgi:hypothetical protein
MYHTATLRYDDQLHVFVSVDGEAFLEIGLEPGELRPDMEDSVAYLFSDERARERKFIPMRIMRSFLRQRGATFDTVDSW